MNVRHQLKTPLYIFTAVVFFFTTPIAGRCQQITITGHVRLKNNAEMENVFVQLWRAGRVIDSIHTGKTPGKSKGYYQVKVKKGIPIDSITFDPPDLVNYGPTKVEQLSGQDQQNISVVIYDQRTLTMLIGMARKGQNVTPIPLANQLGSLEHVYFLQIVKGMPKEMIVRKYGSFVRAITEVGSPLKVKTSAMRYTFIKAKKIHALYFGE